MHAGSCILFVLMFWRTIYFNSIIYVSGFCVIIGFVEFLSPNVTKHHNIYTLKYIFHALQIFAKFEIYSFPNCTGLLYPSNINILFNIHFSKVKRHLMLNKRSNMGRAIYAPQYISGHSHHLIYKDIDSHFS